MSRKVASFQNHIISQHIQFKSVPFLTMCVISYSDQIKCTPQHRSFSFCQICPFFPSFPSSHCFDTFEFVSDAPPTLFVIMLFLACARYYLLKICHRIEISWIPPSLWRSLYEYCLNSLSYARAYLRNDAIISSINNTPYLAGVIPSSQTTSHQKRDVSFDLSFAF